jgi:hypothetical protein
MFVVSFLSSLAIYFDGPIICKTVKYIDHWTTALGVDSALKSRLIDDWSAQNMNHDMS